MQQEKMEVNMVFNEINRFDDTEHETMMGIWWSGILLKQVARKFFKDTPVSDSQFNALMVLKYAEKKLSQQELSERLLVDKSNVTVIADGLEKIGFAKRKKLPGDRRFYQLVLTPAGAEFLDKIETEYRQLIHEMLSDFSEKEMKQLTGYMVRLQRRVSQL